MRFVRFRPSRPQTVDDLKQKGSGCSSPHKSAVCSPIKISNPNREHIMVEHSNRLCVMKTVGRSSLPKNRRGLVRISGTNFRPRVVEHFESENFRFQVDYRVTSQRKLITPSPARRM